MVLVFSHTVIVIGFSLEFNIQFRYFPLLLSVAFLGDKKEGTSSQPGRGLSVFFPSFLSLPFLFGFPSPSDEEEDEEEVYKMAGVMAQCGGLECMLNRLAGIKDFKQGRHLLTVSWGQQGGSSPLL